MPAGQMRGVPQPPGGRIEGTGRTDDEPMHIGPGHPCGLHGPVERLGDLPYDTLGAPPRGRQLELPDGGAGDIGDGGVNALRRHIEPGGEGGARVDGVQLRIGPGPPLGGPGGDDEPGGFEPREQLRGGGLGEAGQLPYLGARQRPVLQQQIERGPVVHGAQYARSTGCGSGCTGCTPGCGSGHDGCTCPSAADVLSWTVRKVSYSAGRKVSRMSGGSQWSARPRQPKRYVGGPRGQVQEPGSLTRT